MRARRLLLVLMVVLAIAACGEDGRRGSTGTRRVDAGLIDATDAGLIGIVDAGREATMSACQEVHELGEQQCCGSANVGAPLPANTAFSFPHPGLIRVSLHNGVPGSVPNQKFWELTIPASPGEFVYRSSAPQMMCAPLEFFGGNVVSFAEVTECEVQLSELRFASSNEVCDGRIAGLFYAETEDGTLSGTFDVALSFTEAELGRQ